jgi:hypothetical protein
MTENDTHVYRVATCDYVTFVKLSYASMSKFYKRYTTFYQKDYHFPSSFINDLSDYCYLNLFDLLLTFVFAIVWTLLREELTPRLFVVSLLKYSIE